MNLSEALNPHIWVGVSIQQTYLAGLLWFISVFAIVRVHNRWTKDWTVFVTLIGWFLLVGGLTRMFFPQPAQSGAQNDSVVFILQMTLLGIGVFLTFKAYYNRENNKKKTVAD
jgi:hypothetical protein